MALHMTPAPLVQPKSILRIPAPYTGTLRLIVNSENADHFRVLFPGYHDWTLCSTLTEKCVRVFTFKAESVISIIQIYNVSNVERKFHYSIWRL